MPEGRKVDSLKRRLRSHLAKNCPPCSAKHIMTCGSENVQSTLLRSTFGSRACMWLWCKAHVQLKLLKTPQLRCTFGSKVHAAMARSTCRSEHARNTTCSDHIWKLRCQKSARRAGGERSAFRSQNVKSKPRSRHF